MAPDVARVAATEDALAPFYPSRNVAPPSSATGSNDAEDVKLLSPAQRFYPCPRPRAAGQALEAASAACVQSMSSPDGDKAVTPSSISSLASHPGVPSSLRSRPRSHTPNRREDALESADHSQRGDWCHDGEEQLAQTSPAGGGGGKGGAGSRAEDANSGGNCSVRAPTSNNDMLSSDPHAQWPELERLWSPEEVRLLRESHLRHTRSVELTDIKKVIADFAATFPDSSRSDASIQRRCREMFPLRPTASTSSAQPASRQRSSPHCGAREELDVGIIYDGGCGVRIENCPRNHYVAVYSSSYVKVTRQPPARDGVISFGHLFQPVFLFHRLQEGTIRALRVPQGTTASTTSVLGGRPGGSTRGAVAVDELYRSPNGFSVLFRTAS